MRIDNKICSNLILNLLQSLVFMFLLTLHSGRRDAKAEVKETKNGKCKEGGGHAVKLSKDRICRQPDNHPRALLLWGRDNIACD